MKILIGVCGIGQGHVTRQSTIAKLLHHRGHELSFLSFGPGIELLESEFPESPITEVYVPWVACDRNGLRLRESIIRSGAELIPGLLRDRKFIRGSKSGSTFDLCISDYEPVTARVSYATGTPLVTLDQQSKLLGFDTPDIGPLSRKEERSRLGLFFPKATKRIALSFFKLDAPADDRYSVELRAPIVRDEIVRPANEHPPAHTTVYLSNYGTDSFVDLAELVQLFSMVPDRSFTIFDSLGRYVDEPENVSILPINRGLFPQKLADSDSVISTAGFNLISECVKSKLPIVTIPLATYDQHLCSRMVQSLGIGTGLGATRCPTVHELVEFLAQIPAARRAIGNSPLVLRPTSDSTTALIDEIEHVGHQGQRR